MHHVRIVLAGENIAGSSHVGSKLINFVKAAVNDMSYERLVPKVADDEIIGICLAEPRIFEVGATHPKALLLQAPHKVMANEAACSTDQNHFSCS
jgi:hypothetical protein